MTRELLIGELEDGTNVIAVNTEAGEGIYVSENVGAGPMPARIIEAVAVVRDKAADLPAPEEY